MVYSVFKLKQQCFFLKTCLFKKVDLIYTTKIIKTIRLKASEME